MIILSEVRTELNFILDKANNIEKLKKELKEVQEIAGQGVRFGMFDGNKMQQDINKLKTAIAGVSLDNIAKGDTGIGQLIKEVKIYENELKLGKLTLSEMSTVYKDVIGQLKTMQGSELAISNLMVKDNELLNRRNDILKNVSAESTILKNNLQSGTITSKEFVDQYRLLIWQLKDIEKADVLISRLEREKTAEIEKQNKLLNATSNNKNTATDKRLQELIKLEEKYKQLNIEAEKYNSQAVKSAQSNVASKLDNMTLDKVDIDAYKKAIDEAKLLSTAKTQHYINNQKLEERASKESSDINKRMMIEDARIAEQQNQKKLLSDKDYYNKKMQYMRAMANLDEQINYGTGTASLGVTLGVGNLFKQLLPLEKQVFDLGVVANKSSADLGMLRAELVGMSQELPFSSAEIGKAINDVARTGKSVEEAFAIVKESAKMAVASGKIFATKTLLCWKSFRVA